MFLSVSFEGNQEEIRKKMPLAMDLVPLEEGASVAFACSACIIFAFYHVLILNSLDYDLSILQTTGGLTPGPLLKSEMVELGRSL